MSVPVCPKPLELAHLIQYYGDMMSDEAKAVTNALRYLETFLTNRRGYQRKMQIKRKLINQLANEQGWSAEIDEAVKRIHGDDMEKMSLEDGDAD